MRQFDPTGTCQHQEYVLFCRYTSSCTAFTCFGLAYNAIKARNGEAMAESPRTLQFGAARITIITIGHLQLDLAKDLLKLPEQAWPSRYAALFSQPLRLPIQSMLIELPETAVLIDPSLYDLILDSPWVIPGYQPPPSLIVQLAEIGVQPNRIAHVVISHLHFDHYSGTTVSRDGRYEPQFPNAQHYVGRADWQSADFQHAVQDTNALEGRTLGILHSKGLVTQVTGNYDLCPELRIIAAPGESPGHQIVRVSSEGQTHYYLGDLYHHPVEVEQPEWIPHWNNVEANRMSRQALTEAALAENALLVATHIPGLGRLEGRAAGAAWNTT
jgi:glyoxylase-like metal-dependent hydrolase (beta-lactamase superfamily II)